MNYEKLYTTPLDAQRFDLRRRQKDHSAYRLEPASDERHRSRVRARSASAPAMLEGRVGRTTISDSEFPRYDRHRRKNSESNPIKPSPSRSKLTCLSQRAFDYFSYHHWSFEGGSRLFCGLNCVSVDPFERGIISKERVVGLNGPMEIHVEVETVVKSDVRWKNSVGAVLFERYPAVDVVSARIC